MWFSFCKVCIRRNFHSRHRRTHRCTASCRKQYQMTARRGKVCYRNNIVTRSGKKIKSFSCNTSADFNNILNVRTARLLHATERLIFKRGYTAFFITRRWVFINDLIMTCEIIFEIIYKRNRLIKNFFINTSVHQNRFCTEHFRHFRKHRTSALAYKLIGKSSYKRICGKSGKAVTAAALQTDNKLRHITFFTFLFFRIFGKLAYKTQPLTDFIIKILRTHKFNSVFVNFTENCFKYGNIIIFAA